jgi:hypothetical protein
MALLHAPRGSGKSFMSAIDTHFQSRFNPRHHTRILGGSLAQSQQIHAAIQEAVIDGHGPAGSDAGSIAEFLAESVRYRNGSIAKILAASPKSVRGPHVPSLKFDEVDEIDPRLREQAMGMAMEIRGQKTSVLMTSTWHRPGGPMSELIEKGRAGAFPVDSYCIFEVLERCPDEISGPDLERCPDCPLVSWCHSDRDRHPSGMPKAKRSSGHYTIRSLIQKAKGVSDRVFKSDYLCQGPQVEGTWFTRFDESKHVTVAAEFDPLLPVEISVDCGVHTGAVLAQIRRDDHGTAYVNIFADYYAEDPGAAVAARSILAVADERCGGARRSVSMDSAGGDRNPVGRTVRSEYEIAGLRGDHGLEYWPKYPSCILDGLALVETFIAAGDGTVRLTIHPRCRRTIDAFQSYRRKLRAGQWVDDPEDPQHPEEEMIDPIRGLLLLRFPTRNRPATQYYATRRAGAMF